MSTYQNISEAPSHPIDSERLDYEHHYQRSLEDPDAFWHEQARQNLSWFTPWTQVRSGDFATGSSRWFEGGQINVSYNCLDRHLEAQAEQPALIWEGDEPGHSRTLSYRQLHAEVCKLANVLLDLGVKPGDRVCVYLPMIPEAAVTLLACTRIGAVHSVVFGGFSADALRDRIQDSGCHLVITADAGQRGGRATPLKSTLDEALAQCPNVHKVIVVRHCGIAIDWVEGRDLWYHERMADALPVCSARPMDSEDPLFILYTSGSTGKPKGIVHSTAGYLLGATLSFREIFAYKSGEVFWCTADIGWITGHTYLLYGPLANGATTLMFEGVPTYPNSSRYWQIIDRHRVNIFYTAPTALRALMREGNASLQGTSRASLRLLGSVGEPINPEAWLWYHSEVGGGRCPIVDTWWQTETGAVMIAPARQLQNQKPGCAARPFFGVQPALLDDKGQEIHGPGTGLLAIKASWPSQLRTIHGDAQRLYDTYFKPYPGYYLTGDGAIRDADGDYWITGRVDDVINVSGHCIGSAEIESALVLHPAVAEAAVVAQPHDIKGQALYAYVTLMHDYPATEALRQELIQHVAHEVGSFARPEVIQWAEHLPKTRSGKIMRRLLRKIACGETDNLGDLSTLADPAVVTQLMAERIQP